MTGTKTEPVLTAAQARILATVRQQGSHVYNARARRPVERLQALGLVTADWDMDLTASGGVRWRITVTPASQEGRAVTRQRADHKGAACA